MRNRVSLEDQFYFKKSIEINLRGTFVNSFPQKDR